MLLCNSFLIFLEATSMKRSLFGKQVLHLKECPSTNTLALEMLQKGQPTEGTLIITDHQTKGRGQQGNAWEAAPQLNLTLSIILYPTFFEAKDHFLLNIALSLAIQNFLQGYIEAPVQLKWPNDFYCQHKKLGGILIENTIAPNRKIKSAVVGIGLNINQVHFGVDTATSMAQLTHQQYDLPTLVEKLLDSLEEKYLLLQSSKSTDWHQQYLQVLLGYHEQRTFQDKDGTYIGIIEGVNQDGRLKVKHPTGERIYQPKEVKFIL